MYEVLTSLCIQSGKHFNPSSENGACSNCGKNPSSSEIDDERLEAILFGCHKDADCGLDSDHEGDCRSYDQIEIKNLQNKINQFQEHVFRTCKCSGITECFLAMQEIK